MEHAMQLNILYNLDNIHEWDGTPKTPGQWKQFLHGNNHKALTPTFKPTENNWEEFRATLDAHYPKKWNTIVLKDTNTPKEVRDELQV
jgi:hypothetical protein